MCVIPIDYFAEFKNICFFVWKNEEYRVTLPYAKIDIAGIAKHCGQTRVKPCFLVNESSCLRVQLKEYDL